jgi:hypothetical protein
MAFPTGHRWRLDVEEVDDRAEARQRLKGLRLPRGLAAHPAFFLALLECEEKLASPGGGTLILRDGCDADARAAEPQVREDALTAAAALRYSFHHPAPYVCGAGHVARLEQEIRTRSQGWRATRQARPLERSLRTLTVCDNERSRDSNVVVGFLLSLAR